MASKKSKILALAMAAALSVGILAGCSGGGDTSTSGDSSTSTGKITLEWWNGFTGSDGVLMESIVQEYNAANADKVEVNLDRIPWANFFEKMPTALATNSGPDFCLWGPGDMPSYIEAGNVVAMDDYWEVDTKKDDYVEAVLDNCYFDGTCYGVPFQVFTQILYWNKDLFTKAGLDPETPPTTWDEVREFSEKITDKANGIYGLGIPNDAQLFDMTRTYGGTYVDGTTHKNMVGETKDGIKEAYTFFQGMIKDGLNPSQVTGPDMDTLFTAGTIGMYQNGPWQIAGNTEKGVNFGVGAVPSGPAGQFVDMGMNNFSILKGITDEQKAATYEFIRWWQRDGAAKRWCTANKFPTYLKSLASDPEIVADPICNVTTSFIEKGELQYKVPMKNITVLNNDYINKAIGNLMDGQDVDSIIATLESDIDAYLAEYEPEAAA